MLIEENSQKTQEPNTEFMVSVPQEVLIRFANEYAILADKADALERVLRVFAEEGNELAQNTLNYLNENHS